ncbi:MAG: amidohydrolase family protein [Acidimicrobiales bacterium]
MLRDDARLVSLNDHLVEPPDLWGGVDDQPHVMTVDGEERWMLGTQSLTVRALSVLGVGAHRATRVSEMHAAVGDPIARVQSMDLDGVAVQTLLPHVIGFAGERLRFLRDSEARLRAVCRYNDFLLREFCASAPDRLAGVAIMPLHDLSHAPEELRRCAALGARAVSLPHAPPLIGLPGFGDDAWQRLFSVAEDAGVAVMIHVGSSGASPSTIGAGSPGAILVQSGFDVANALIDLLYAYVLVGHPRLRIVLVEGGIGWLPYVIDRIEFFARQRPEVWSPPSRQRTPGDILREQVHVSFIDDAFGLTMLGAVAAEHVHWQCDFPHADSPWPHSRAALGAQLAHVDERTARGIAGANTEALLGL